MAASDLGAPSPFGKLWIRHCFTLELKLEIMRPGKEKEQQRYISVATKSGYAFGLKFLLKNILWGINNSATLNILSASN